MPSDRVLDAPQTMLPPVRRQHSAMIKNLVPRLPERGHVKIGVKGEMITSQRGNKFQPPEKLDHFRVTTLERGEDGNFLIDRAFHEKFGETPTDIPVRLLYDDATLNFPTRYACFIGKSLWCSGDGEGATRMTETPQEMLNEKRVMTPREVECTCVRQEPTYQQRDKCKMNGNLSVLIDGMGGVGGVWKFRTTSYNSIVGIMSSMAFLRSVTGGVLANIPFRLTLRPKQASNPIDGKAVTIYVVGLEFAGDIAELQDVGHKIALNRASTHISIAHIEDEARQLLTFMQPDVPLPGDVAKEIVEEFYPEQVDGSQDAETPPRPTREEFKTGPVTDVAEVEPITWEVVNMVGEVMTFDDLGAALDAYQTALDTAEKQKGDEGLHLVYDNNAGLFQTLDENGHADLSKELSADLGERRQAAHAREVAAQAEAEKMTTAATSSASSQPTEIPRGIEEAPTETIRERDRVWWSRDVLSITGFKNNNEFVALLHQRLREARTEGECECLSDASGGVIDALPKATKEDVLGRIADRRKELRR